MERSTKMKKLIVLLVPMILIIGLYVNSAQSGDVLPQCQVTMEQCMSQVVSRVHGDVLIVEFLTSEGVPVYEFEVKMKDGTVWNVECNGLTGCIIDFSRHVSADDPLFKSKAKISQQEAEKIALSFIPGKVDHREIYIEGGKPIYEFDINPSHGGEFKVEVEADTGTIDVVEPEYWEIGNYSN
jgi:uncharacterized membrane protein YkoI